MKEINLEEILNHYKVSKINNKRYYTENRVKEAIREGIKQALELASEEGELTEFAKEFLQEGVNEAINKESITNLINRIK